MKKKSFLSLLVFCIIIIFFLYQLVMINTKNQGINSETKEELVRYSREPLVEETKEIKSNNNENNKVEEKSLNDEIETNKAEEVNLNDEVEINKTEEESLNNEVEINKTEEESLNNEVETIETKKVNQKILSKESNYSFLKISGNIDEENIRYAENEIKLIPSSLIATFSNDGWNIFITNENINQKYFGGSYDNVMGVTITGTNEIYIQNRKNSIQQSIVHEFGHFVDCINDFPSLNEEFSEIYNEEASTFKSRISNSSCVRDEMEFFAHTFYYLIKDSSKCTPRAAEYVQRYM